MKILITGICGFIGSALARLLIESGTAGRIIGIDNLSRSGSELNRAPLRQLGVTLIHGDIRLPADLEDLPRPDWVIDAAANPSVLAGRDGRASSHQVMQHNLVGTINVLEYCKRHSAGLVMLSTSRVYSTAELCAIELETADGAFRPTARAKEAAGVSEVGVSEKFSTEPPLSLYGASKRASELLALEYGLAFEFPVWIDRCGVLAGAGQFGRADQGIFSYWIHAYRSGRPLAYFGYGGSGYQVRDCLHPRDLFSLVQRQLGDASDGKPNIANAGGGIENSLSLAQLTRWCEERFAARAVGSETQERPYDVPWLVLDSRVAKAEWTWEAETSLTEILEEIARHAEENPNWLELSGC